MSFEWGLFLGVLVLGIIPALGLYFELGRARWFFALLLLGWCWGCGWLLIMLTNPRWLDNSHERSFVEALIKAIEQGKTSVPLKELTDFDWTAVCFLGQYARYDYAGSAPESERAIVREALGTDYVRELDTWLGYEERLRAFATPKGVVVIEGVEGRLSGYFQKKFKGRYYRDALKGKGYSVKVITKAIAPHKVTSWEPLCYVPEQAVVLIQPE